MNKVAQILLKYLGIPLLEKLGKYLYNFIVDYIEEQKIKKEIAKKAKELKNAKTPEEIRRSIRNINL